MIRQLCEAYPGTTPAHYEELSQDQIYIMSVKKSSLMSVGGMTTVSVDAARELGVVPVLKPGEPRSLVQRIRAKTKADQEANERKTKRQKRKEWDENLKAARARGDII